MNKSTQWGADLADCPSIFLPPDLGWPGWNILNWSIGGDVGAWRRCRGEAINSPEPQEESASNLYTQILAETANQTGSYWTAYHLGYLKNHAEALQFALRLSWDPAPEYRRLGVVALARLQSRGLMDANRRLRDLVADRSDEVRRTLAAEIHTNENPETGEILLALAADPNPTVRAEIPDGLYIQATPDARRAFLLLLRDKDEGVRISASRCLPYFNQAPIRPDEALDLRHDLIPEVRAHVARWLSWESPDIALEPLFELVEDTSGLVRNYALDALNHFLGNDIRVFSRILMCFDDPDPNVRTKATELLHRHPSLEVVKALLKHAGDPSNGVRQFVARGLEGRANIEMLPILEKLSVDDSSSLIRWATAKALAPLPGADAEALLVGLMKDPAKRVATAARKILECRAKLPRLTMLTLLSGAVASAAR